MSIITKSGLYVCPEPFELADLSDFDMMEVAEVARIRGINRGGRDRSDHI